MTAAYKVLVNGASCHGGALAWSLPTQDADGAWTPGEWHEVAGEIVVCSNGLHLTTRPAYWWQSGADVYEAEYDGDVDDPKADDGKFAVRRARLLRTVSWDDHQVWSDGEHSVTSGRAVAFGSASVRASDSASVEAFGSASVRASGSASVVRARWHTGGYLRLSDLAAVIDRREDGTVRCHVAPWSDDPADGHPSETAQQHGRAR